MPNNLSKHILATISYYDVMDYPMTSFEIWKYLTIISGEEEESYSLSDVMQELEGEKLKRFIKEEKGFYVLKDRVALTEQRIYRNKISEKKFKHLLRMVNFLRFFPYIKMIGVTGRMAMKNAETKSDLDLLIVFQRGKMWTGRALVTFFMQILGKRRYGKKIKDRICLNHFITEEFSISIKDIFSTNEYVFLLPIYGFSSFLKFQEKNNWIKKFKPNIFFEIKNLKKIKESPFSRSVQFFLEKIFIFNFIENTLRRWQKKKIESNPKTSQSGSMIICEDSELAFWPNFENQGPRIFAKFKERLNKISQL